MQEDKNHIIFTAEDIRRYHEGKLTSRQMHEMEKASLEDPFLADALEGYAVENVQVPADIDELRKRLEERVAGKKVIPLAAPAKPFNWLRVAAMIIAVAGAGLLVYNLGFNKKETTIAQQNTNKFTGPEDQSILKEADAVNELKADTMLATAGKAAPDSVAAVKQRPVRSTGIVSPATPMPLQEDPALLPAEKAKSANKDDLAQNIEKGLATVTAPASKGKETRAPLNDPDSRQSRSNFYAQREKAEKNLADEASNVRQDQLNLAKARRSQNSYSSINVFRGKVTDQQNNPLPFANITNNADNIGTYADAQGNFVLTSPDSTMDVQVRSLGFENSNIQLQNNLSLNRVTLKDDESTPPIVLSNKKVNAKLRENNMVLEEPEPADGWSKYDAYLANNLNIPDNYKAKQLEGNEVTLSFEVNQTGDPINIRVERSLCEVCDKEAIRLLKEGPKWKRKAKKGKRTTVTIPF